MVYGSTYLNSSKKLSKYPDYDFPEEWPHYLSRAQAQDYLRSYAREFGLYDHIKFNSRVASAERIDGRWRIQIEGESKPRFYDGLIVANGHHWHPNWPSYPGSFTGEILHSHDVKSKEQLKGKRVLVVGAGNSAVDILDDAAHDGARAVHSMRRSYYFFPKLVFGKPTDAFIDSTSRWPLPRCVMRKLYWWGMRITVGSHWRYNLPAPDHEPVRGASHRLHALSRSHRAWPHRGQARHRAAGRQDACISPTGASEEFDLIVYATGFRPSFPFMDQSLILDSQGRSKLFIHTFDREHDDLFVVGLFEPAEGGVWQLADYQAKLVASFIVAHDLRPEARRLVPQAEGERHAGYRPWHPLQGHALA